LKTAKAHKQPPASNDPQTTTHKQPPTSNHPQTTTRKQRPTSNHPRATARKQRPRSEDPAARAANDKNPKRLGEHKASRSPIPVGSVTGAAWSDDHATTSFPARRLGARRPSREVAPAVRWRPGRWPVERRHCNFSQVHQQTISRRAPALPGRSNDVQDHRLQGRRDPVAKRRAPPLPPRRKEAQFPVGQSDKRAPADRRRTGAGARRPSRHAVLSQS